MTDEELAATADDLRGTAKRGRRRMLTEAETVALAAVIEEQRQRWAYGAGPGTLAGSLDV